MDKNEKELETIREMIERAGTETQKLAVPLVNHAIFMSGELDKLKKELEKPGAWVTSYTVGVNHKGRCESPEGKAYHKLIKDFNTTVKNLYAILNERIPEPEDDLAKFLKKKETR